MPLRLPPQSRALSTLPPCPRLSRTSLPPTATLKPYSGWRPFSSSPSRASDHGSQYDPPSGWLFGVAPGKKYEKEGWENIWIYGFWGTLLVLGVGGWVFREDTSIQTWALEEARRRLEAEGILEDPSPVTTKSIPATIADSLPSIPALTESSKEE